MKRLAISSRLQGLLEDMDNESPRHTVRDVDVYDSEKSYCANSDLLFSEASRPEKRNISPEEYKRQREAIIARASRW